MSTTADLVKVAYKVLFSLEVELEGRGIVRSNLSIVPDVTTTGLFTKYKILSKKYNGATVILIETEPEGVDKGKPKIMLGNNEMFRFQVKIDTGFLSETHLASYDFTEYVLYASNSANNVVDSNVLLSLPIQIYNVSGEYENGYLVQAGGKYYKAVQPSNSGSPHAITETDYWKEINSPSFISQVDLRTRNSLSQPVDLDTNIVVEVVHNATLSADYQLLDGYLKCREVIYKIRLHT